MSRPHSLTSELIAREIFNPETGGVKVEMLPMEMSIELSHADGDSVTAYKAAILLSLAANSAGSVLGTTTLTIYAEPSKQVFVAPGVEGPWILAGTTDAAGLLTLQLAASQVKCEDACKVVAV
jgi:hypothetical protein